MDFSKCRIPMRPLAEIEEELKTGCKNRKKILKRVSNRYIEENVDCLNEVFNTNYRKTVLVEHSRTTDFYITVYSNKVLSNLIVYAIGMSYQRDNPAKINFLQYIKSFYPEIKDFESRMRLYEHVENGLIIVLDIDPEKLGLNPSVMQWTKTFNAEQGDGTFKTVIKPYIDFDIVVTSNLPITVKDVINIAQSYKEAQSWVINGEEGATLEEVSSVLQRTEFSKKINAYEYHYGFLAIEIE